MASECVPQKDSRLKWGKRRLVLAGILWLVSAIVSLILLLIYFVGMLLSREVQEAIGGLPYGFLRLLVPIVVTAWAITLGFGSVALKRWARALSLAYHYMKLFFGIPNFVIAAVYAPHFFQTMPTQDIPTNMVSLFETISLLVVLFIFVGFPLLMVGLYGGRHGKAICDYYHPQPDWTDKCPFPVLLAIFFFAYAALGSIQILLLSSFTFPLMGVVCTGISAVLVMAGISFLNGWLAYGLYTMKKGAWVGSLPMTIAGTIVIIVTVVRRHGPYTRMSLMGLPEDFYSQLNAILPYYTVMIAAIMLWMIVLVCYSSGNISIEFPRRKC